MTREEKIDMLINNLMDNWGSLKDFDMFVKAILKNGYRGYSDLSDEEIDEDFSNTFDNEE